LCVFSSCTNKHKTIHPLCIAFAGDCPSTTGTGTGGAMTGSGTGTGVAPPPRPYGTLNDALGYYSIYCDMEGARTETWICGNTYVSSADVFTNLDCTGTRLLHVVCTSLSLSPLSYITILLSFACFCFFCLFACFYNNN